MNCNLQPVNIELDDLTIHGLQHNKHSSHQPKILCLHGWLDNANSFYPLLPLLHEFNCVAIDLPGHGKSSHLKNDVPYTIASTGHYVLQTANALGWDNFHIIGHSLGGCIAPVCAIAEPDRIESLLLIDALGPISESAEALPDRLRRFHHEMKLRRNTDSRLFDSVDQAVDTRLKAAKMHTESARLIIERQLVQVTNGYKWRFDPKLRAASPGYYTEAQVQSILGAVDCPAHCIIADEGHLAKLNTFEQRSQRMHTLSTTRLPGNHHLHMDHPEPVAGAIIGFLQSHF